VIAPKSEQAFRGGLVGVRRSCVAFIKLLTSAVSLPASRLLRVFLVPKLKV
jgi:hypothetical protein